MKPVFADTIYWVALINPSDEWRGPALAATSLLNDPLLITTDSILVEVLNFFAERGHEARLRAVAAVEELRTNAHTRYCPKLTKTFLPGWISTKRAPTKAIV